MSSISYEEYLPLRGDEVKPEELVPGRKYYMEDERELPNRTVYTGVYYYTAGNTAFFTDENDISTMKFVVNPFDHTIAGNGISIDPYWGVKFYNTYNVREANENVDTMVDVLTRKNIPVDVASHMALNILDTHGLTDTAKEVATNKTTSNLTLKHSKTNKKGGRKNRTIRKSNYKKRKSRRRKPEGLNRKLR